MNDLKIFSESKSWPSGGQRVEVQLEQLDTFQIFSCSFIMNINQCLLLIEAKDSKKMYEISAGTLMEPIYSQCHPSEPILQHIDLHKDQHKVRIKSKCQQDLLQIYQKFKRNLSHKGFNQSFKPIRRLGKGAFATVYLVESKVDGKRYAAKVFSREGQKLQFKGREALENQIRTLRMMNHPNVIKYEGIYQTDNLIYLITEHLDGGTLQEYMRDRIKLSGDVILHILSDSLTALTYIQQNKIMHRDLKPSNILKRNEDQKWVLADFGLSAHFDQEYLYDKCGTMGYMAPQVMTLEGKSQSPSHNSACDLYSLGVITYELIVGHLPFKVETEGLFQKKIVWNGFSREEFTELDQSVATLLQGLLEKNPEKRMTAPQALKQDLFRDKKVAKSWNEFCQKKIDTRYDRILKMANIN